MISEPNTGRCVSLLTVPQRGIDTRWCASKDVGLQRGVDLGGGVPHRLEKGTSASKDAGPKGGVDCNVPRWLGRKEGKSERKTQI